MARSKSSGRWLAEHHADEFVKKAQGQGYRSRAVFKLLEVQEKDRLIRPGMRVLDLGAAPGGWSQLARQQVGTGGQVIALDLLAMESLPGVIFIQGDFRDEAILKAIDAALQGEPVDVVLSDMAPNLSGSRAIDQPRAMFLAELALDTARNLLIPGGSFLVKLFQGAGAAEFQQTMKTCFSTVSVRKPKASRDRSREFYLLGSGFKG